jgi:hypothetical protein
VVRGRPLPLPTIFNGISSSREVAVGAVDRLGLQAHLAAAHLLQAGHIAAAPLNRLTREGHLRAKTGTSKSASSVMTENLKCFRTV